MENFINPFLVQIPQQERSRLTMNQILDAAARILESKTFEELTIAEVVEQAGSSVGAFYGRFQDKDALLEALDARFFEELESNMAPLLEPGFWEGKPLAEMIRTVAELLLRAYVKDRGVLRSLNLKARLHGDSRFRQRELHAWEELFPAFQHLLLQRRDQIRHPDPELATRFGFQQLFFTLREIILWESLNGDTRYGKTVLIDELTRAFLAYLDAAE